MCFHFTLTKSKNEIENRFDARFGSFPENSLGYKNAYEHPHSAIITNLNRHKIENFCWGLIPPWANDLQLRKYTLNARAETYTEKPSFRASSKNHCLILADSFFEWQWLDEKGKNKQQFWIFLIFTV